MFTRLALALALALGVVACEDPIAPLRPDSGAGTDGDVPPSGVTYYGEVRPILVANCTMCHTPGGIAPFSLESYELAREVSERMMEVTRDHIMPPFLADNSGTCNTWSNHRGLTDAEIAVIAAWNAAGAPEGDRTTSAPTPVELPGLPSSDLSIEMASTYTIDGTVDDDYRCFVVESGTTEDRFITGYDVHPGNTQRVHHVIVYSPESAAAEAEARARDTGQGYPCYGGADVPSSPVVIWAPGAGATLFPTGTGLAHPAGRALILQIHYNNLVEDSSDQDQTSVDLSTTTSARPAALALISDYSLNLPPGQASVIESEVTRFTSLTRDYEVWGVYPHMHTLGRRIGLQINPATGPDQCLLDVPRWDFNWQLMYWLDTPLTVGPSDSVTITCDFDTSDRTAVTTFGEGTLDEMCLAFVYATAAR